MGDVMTKIIYCSRAKRTLFNWFPKHGIDYYIKTAGPDETLKELKGLCEFHDIVLVCYDVKITNIKYKEEECGS